MYRPFWRRHLLFLFLALGLLAACAGGAPSGGPGGGPGGDLGARLAAANLLAGSTAAGLREALAAGAVSPGSDRALALLATLAAVELALDGAGNAWRAGLPDLAAANLAAAERQMTGMQPLLPPSMPGE